MSASSVPQAITEHEHGGQIHSTRMPTILLIHGSWHTAIHYKKQLDFFNDAGFPTCCPLLPSFNAAPSIGLIEDAKCIEEELRRLVDVQKEIVIVIGHSYGGVVATEAVSADFGVEQRREKGLPGGVRGIVFCAAFMLSVGESLGSALGGGPPPKTKLPPFIPVDEQGMCTMMDPETRFYNDLPHEEQQHWASLLKPCPAITQLQPITHAAYAYHPVMYVVCENDQGLPSFLQRKMIADVEAHNSGVRFDIEICNAGHSPFLSQPEVLIRVVEKMSEKWP